jgi:phosphohistidine swiveling domain-containing protein
MDFLQDPFGGKTLFSLKEGRSILPWVGGKGKGVILLYERGFPVPETLFYIPSGRKEPFPLKGVEKILGRGPFFVRSSFLYEDEVSTSFAGLFRTVPHVPLEELPSAVEEVLRSYEGVSSTYSNRSSIGSVLIQREIIPFWSGVFFTRSPGTLFGFYRLEAVKGYGEALVSGKEKPWIVEGHPRKKRWKKRIPSPLKKVLSYLLSHRNEFESITGGPADLEWVLTHKGEIYIVQIRPVLERKKEVYSSTLAEEFWCGEVSPLMFSLVGKAIEEVMLLEPFTVLLPSLKPPLLILRKGKVYVRVDPLVSALVRLPFWAVSEDVLRHFPSWIRERFMEEQKEYRPWLPPEIVTAFFRFVKARFPWFPFFQPLVFPFLKRKADLFLSLPVPDRKEDLIGEIDLLVEELKNSLRYVVWGMVYCYLLLPMWIRWIGEEKWERIATSFFRSLPLDALPAFLNDLRKLKNTLGKGKEEGKEISTFLRRWGHRPSDRDLRSLRLEEDRNLLFRLLKLSEDGKPPDPPWWHFFLSIRDFFWIPPGWIVRLYLGFREGMRDLSDRYLWAIRKRILRLQELESISDPFLFSWEKGKGFVPFREDTVEGEFYEGKEREETVTMRGLGVGTGEAEGIVIPIENFSPENCKEKIVAGLYLEPTYSLFLRNAKGGIFAYGGILSHGAVLAREFGVPVVVGVGEEGVRSLLGKKVKISGKTGEISVLEEEKN